MDVRCVVKSDDRLGAGPCWSPVEGRLYWFDALGRRLAWYEPSTDDRGAFDLPVRASAAAARVQGGVVMATEKGLIVCEPAKSTLEVVSPYELPAGFRSGAGSVDPNGDFWWSILDESGAQTGSVFRTRPDFKTERMLTGIYRPDTVAFSPDGARLYVADAKLQTLFVHETAQLSKAERFAHTAGAPASPGGSAVDADGRLWNAQPGGWRVARYAPDGQLAESVALPVQLPTACAFGGADLRTLFVTTAWDGLGLGARAQQPLAGNLFAIDTGAPGLALPLFAG